MEATVVTTAEIMSQNQPLSPPLSAEVPAADGLDDLPVTIIERRPGWHLLDVGELFRYRELLYFLTWRDVKVRYKQTVLGASWAVLQPLATMIVFSLFFTRMGEVKTPVPYPLFVFAGLIPWFFFSNAITAASQSVVGNQNLVTKIFFPRLIIPMGAVGAGLVDFVVAFVMLVGLMLYFMATGEWGFVPGLGIMLLPLLTVGLVIAALGIGILLSALTVAYRDFRYVVPFMVQLWMFATPTIYLHADDIGQRWRPLLPLNPAYGLIANFRVAVLGGEFDWYALTVSSVVTLVLFVTGCLYFRRVERGFADII